MTPDDAPLALPAFSDSFGPWRPEQARVNVPAYGETLVSCLFNKTPVLATADHLVLFQVWSESDEEDEVLLVGAVSAESPPERGNLHYYDSGVLPWDGVDLDECPLLLSPRWH